MSVSNLTEKGGKCDNLNVFTPERVGGVVNQGNVSLSHA